MHKQPKLRVYDNGGSLSEADLTLIKDSNILIRMMRNRILIQADTRQAEIDWDSLTSKLIGFYHIRPVDRDNMIFQVWFEIENDMHTFKKQLMIKKLATS
jgi:hypothetical protein